MNSLRVFGTESLVRATQTHLPAIIKSEAMESARGVGKTEFLFGFILISQENLLLYVIQRHHPTSSSFLSATIYTL